MIIELREFPVGSKLKKLNVELTFDNDGPTLEQTFEVSDETLDAPVQTVYEPEVVTETVDNAPEVPEEMRDITF